MHLAIVAQGRVSEFPGGLLEIDWEGNLVQIIVPDVGVYSYVEHPLGVAWFLLFDMPAVIISTLYVLVIYCCSLL